MRGGKRSALVRAIPLALLLAVVVAIVMRRGTSQPPPPPAMTMDASSAVDAGRRRVLPAPSADDASYGAPRMMHGGPRRLHRSSAHGPRAAIVGWRVRLDGPIAAQVTVSPDGATLYAATLGGSVVALSRSDGTQRWSRSLGDRVYATPLVDDDKSIYVGTDAKKFVRLSPNGEVVFRLDTDGDADTAAVLGKDGTIIFAAGKSVYAVRRGGDLAWRFAAKAKVFTAPAVTNEGLVVFGSQDHRVYALTPAGTLAWSVDLGADVDGSPVVGDDGSIYVGTDAGDVVKVAASGVVWRAPVGGFVRGPLSMARNGDVLVGTYGPAPRLVSVAPDGRVDVLFAIGGTGAREFGIHGGPLEDADGNLYFGAQDDAAYAIDANGAPRWRYPTSGDIDAPLTLLPDGSLVVPSEDGTVTLLLP